MPVRRKLLNFGNASRKSQSSHRIPLDVRIGMVMKPGVTTRKRYLNSVKFRLASTGELAGAQDPLEIRVYRMQDNTIEDVPANTAPIYVRLDQLKRMNDVKLDERIEIPVDGVFVSFELPGAAERERDDHITFTMSVTYDDCNEYVGKATNSVWNAATFPGLRSCRPSPFNQKYAQLSVGITYFEAD